MDLQGTKLQILVSIPDRFDIWHSLQQCIQCSDKSSVFIYLLHNTFASWQYFCNHQHLRIFTGLTVIEWLEILS